MNLFALASLSVGISCFILSALTLFFGKTKLHRLLLFFNIAVAAWGIGSFFAGIAATESDAIFGWKLAHLGGFFVGALFYHMVCVFCEIQRKRLLYFAYLQALIFNILSFGTKHIFTETRFVFGIYYNEATPLFILGLLSYLLLIFLSFYELFRLLPGTQGYKRTQTLYMIFGFMIGFIGGTSTFLPEFRIDILYPVGNFGITLYVIVITYAILRYRIIDIHLIFKKSLVYSISAGILTSLFILLVLIMTEVFSDFVGSESFAITIISALIIAFLFNPLKNRTQLFIDKVFYKTTYDYYNVIQKVSRELAATIDINYVYKIIVETVFTTLKLKTVHLLSAKNNRFESVHFRLFSDKPHNENIMHTHKIDSDSQLIKLLGNKDEILFKEEMQMKAGQDKENIIAEELKPFMGEVISPIIIDNELTFLLILGEKLSGDIFYDEDIQLLSTITNQSAIALKNAKLYENSEKQVIQLQQAEKELKKHRDHLHELVKEQTAELLRTNEQLQNEIGEHIIAEEKKTHLLKEVEYINQELRDFIYIASHDLKSPLRAIGTLANWIATDYSDKLDKDGKEQLDLLVKRVNKMHDLIDGILKYSKIEHVREENVKVNINELLKEVIDMIDLPENTKITVENELPSLLCEKTRIMEVFQNLISNAVGYMDKPEGLIKIACIEDYGYWKFSVSDNGPGIEEKYFEKIFKIFQTLSPPDKQGNTGVGLTIVKKIIKTHGGDVWVESEVGQGSTFFFTLPENQKIQ